MVPAGSRIAAAALALVVSGCVGVPSLRPDSKPSGPRVEAIERQVSCEIYRSKNMQSLAQNNYFISVLMTLQVDDSVDITPSVGFIHPFTAATESVTATLAADFGGARRRTFTANYTLNASDLNKSGARWCDKSATHDAFENKAKLYRLDGSLGLDEIIGDGFEIVADGHPALHSASSATDKAAPSFGSYVQFIVTRSLTSLGPVWSVKRFKGPGTANSGLLNGKRLDTDSLLLTFAPQFVPPPTPPGPTPEDEQLRHLQEAVDAQNAQIALLKAEGSLAEAKAHAKRGAATQAGRSRKLSSTAKQALSKIATSAEQHADTVRTDLISAQVSQLNAATALATAQAKAEETKKEAAIVQAQAPAAAINATQNLQQTMILQNLANSAQR